MGLKEISLCVFAAVALQAISCKAGKKVDAQQEQTVADTLQTDSIAYRATPDSLLECHIVADYPSGNDSLSQAVAIYVSNELGRVYLPLVSNGGQTKSFSLFSGDKTKGKAVVDYYGKCMSKYLFREFNDMRSEGVENLPGMSCDVAVRKVYENDRYLTYTTSTYTYLGGAHGSSVSYSVNIVKPSGKVLEETVDTLKVGQMQPILRKGIMAYLHENGDAEATEKNLENYLFLENGVVPMPSQAPCLTDKGVCFVYQQYEIGPYALGMVTFTVPYKEILPYLKPEVRTLVVN